MKKRIWITALIATLILSGCGAGDKGADTNSANGSYSTNASTANMESGGFTDYDYAEAISADEAWSPEPAEAEEAPAGGAGSTKVSESGGTSTGSSAGEIEREMLVYSCSMSIDTLDFTATVNGFRTLLDQYGGFIETENYDDGGSYSRWYSEASEKWQSYSATVRIPSRNYDAFCNSAGNLGDLRSKNASVQNLSSEYHDLSTALEIYEAKEERYIALLADITEDEYAVAIERELTDLQVQIATIKSRMNKINTDVTYSYVYITINEVKEYVSEPVKTDTFFDRLLNTVRNTGRNFVGFLEDLLFFVIRLIPYLVLIALLVLVTLLLTKKRRAKRRALRQAQTTRTAPQMPQSPQATQAAQAAQAAPSVSPVQAAQNPQTPQTVSTTQTAQETQADSTAQATQAAQHPRTAQTVSTTQTVQETQTVQAESTQQTASDSENDAPPSETI
ncbi:MAG: DUF4349 domain-containing protein [bacterium]|nr:DUF4349 domain-containing protein [bacterium]